jgi:hypothetical protein
MSVARPAGTDPSLHSVVRRELRPDEKLQWAERPGGGALARTESVKAVVGIPFLAFALFWTYMAGGKAWLDGEASPSGLFPLFGLIFVVVGLGLVLSPLWAWFRARWIAYAISDRRLIIISTFPVHRVWSYAPEDIQELERTDRGDRSGDLVFRREHPGSGRWSRSYQVKRIGFFGIANARRVEDMVRDLKLQKT